MILKIRQNIAHATPKIFSAERMTVTGSIIVIIFVFGMPSYGVKSRHVHDTNNNKSCSTTYKATVLGHIPCLCATKNRRLSLSLRYATSIAVRVECILPSLIIGVPFK